MSTKLLQIRKFKKYIVSGVSSLMVLLVTSPLWANPAVATANTVAWESVGKAFSGAILLAIGALGCALGMSKIGLAAIEGMARQPEVQGRLFTTMLIGMALIEALCLYCLVVSLMLIA